VKASAATLPRKTQNHCKKPLRHSHFLGRQNPSWRQIAGPPLTPDQLRAATVPDGPARLWKGGEFERIEAKNRAALKTAEEAAVEANGQFTEPDWREVVSPDGVVGCFVTRFRDQQPARGPVLAQVPLPDDMSIPSFLDRRLKTT
jgi:hypothetical protein